jgi:hypothetical protein
MTRLIAPVSVAAGLSALSLLVAGTAHAAAVPATTTLKIIAAELSGATTSGSHLNVAVTGSCAVDQDTAGLLVTTDSPQGTADDLLECTDKPITQIVAVWTKKGQYRTGSTVKITAVLRTKEKKVLTTDTKTVNVQ